MAFRPVVRGACRRTPVRRTRLRLVGSTCRLRRPTGRAAEPRDSAAAAPEGRVRLPPNPVASGDRAQACPPEVPPKPSALQGRPRRAGNRQPTRCRRIHQATPHGRDGVPTHGRPASTRTRLGPRGLPEAETRGIERSRRRSNRVLNGCRSHDSSVHNTPKLERRRRSRMTRGPSAGIDGRRAAFATAPCSHRAAIL